MLTTFSWDDRNVRRVFIRKVRGKSPEEPGCSGLGSPGPQSCLELGGQWGACGSPMGCLSFQVYAILMVQLLVTLVIVAFFTFW